MPIQRPILLLPVLLTGLGACATNADPGQGGFISGVAGLSSGSYQQRIDERQAALEAEQAQQASLEARQQNLTIEQARLTLEAQQLRGQLGTQRQQIERLRQRYRNAASEADRLRLARLDAVAVRADAELAAPAGPALTGDALERKVADLRTLIGDMNGLVQELGAG